MGSEESQPSVLKIYYKGTCQEMSVADGTDENKIFEQLKRIFRIPEDISDFFFQDSEGRIVVLPQKFPEELSLFLYVRSGAQDLSNISQTQENQLKWKFVCTPGTEEQLTDGIHYHPINNPDPKLLPTVISSIFFSQGKHFTVIKVDSHGCGWIGLGLPGLQPQYFNPSYTYRNECNGSTFQRTFIQIGESECDQVSKYTGIAIDYTSKICYFLKVNTDTFQPVKIIAKVTELPISVIIFAGVKNWNCFKPNFTGITLIKDSLPFPDLSGLNFEGESICWNKDQFNFG